MLHERFTANMRRIRENRGLTQQDLADALDVSRPYIAELEAGRHVPTLKIVERVAIGLGVQTETLLGEVPQSFSQKIAG